MENKKESIFNSIKTLIFAVILAILIRSFIFIPAVVPSGSMEPTIVTNSRIIVLRYPYFFNEPQRGDIVTFYYPDDESTVFLKRIIGMPGETIEGKDGVIYINGEPLDNDYTDIKINEDFPLFTIPDDSYFMMGDNRNNSKDSRYWKNSFVKRNRIIGIAAFEVYPEVKTLK